VKAPVAASAAVLIMAPDFMILGITAIITMVAAI
jgi:hypothetical protein